jgi:PleD family two-component response regulator
MPFEEHFLLRLLRTVDAACRNGSEEFLIVVAGGDHLSSISHAPH